MEQKTIDKFVFAEAKTYLLGLEIPGINPELIEKYLNPIIIQPRPESIQEIYIRILESAQNGNMKAGVIGRSIGGIQKLSPILFDFNPIEVLKYYEKDAEKLLDDIVLKIKPRGKVRRTPISIWPQYCRSVLSGAEFISQFESADDFFGWVDSFDKDVKARANVLESLIRQINGFGFALSCDFLKEMGYVNFPKPDVHLRDIFYGLGLCDEKTDDYRLFKRIVQLSENADVTPYKADKIFWLIGSGYFYDDLHLGKNGRVGSFKNDFIKKTKVKIARLENDPDVKKEKE